MEQVSSNTTSPNVPQLEEPEVRADDILPNHPPGSAPKTRNKLGLEGAAILQDYWLKNPSTSLPPLNDRKELTKKIKELPGNDFWSDTRTTEWFKRRIKKRRTQDALQAQTLGLPLEQLLPALRHLGVLLKAQPNPPPDVIRTWATLLAHSSGGVGVDSWIAYVQGIVSSSTSAPLHSANLPTPAGTVTPEPSLQTSLSPQSLSNLPLPSKLKHDPDNSPTFTPLLIGTQLSSAAAQIEPQSPESPISAGTESSLTPSPSAGHKATTLKDIIQDVTQTFSIPDISTTQDGPFPTNADEFVAMFSPYEDKLTKLLDILKSQS